MNKNLTLVYQDCFKCGSTAHWTSMQQYYAQKNGYTLEAKSFVMPGMADLIKAANKKGIKLPFITDGTHFGYGVLDVLKQIKPAKKTTTKKRTRSKKVDESV